MGLHGSSDSFWGSSMKIVTMQRRVACILCRDDAHKSISDTRCPSQKHHVIYLFFLPKWCCVVLCGGVWWCVVVRGAAWRCVGLCGVVWCCVVLCGARVGSDAAGANVYE